MDRMQEINDALIPLRKEIRELADRQKDWVSEDREKWDRVNKEYDDLKDEATALREAIEVEARAAGIEQTIEKQKAETRSEIGEHRRLTSGEPTEEHKAGALQALLRYSDGHDLTSKHEECVGMVKLDLAQAAKQMRGQAGFPLVGAFRNQYRSGAQMWNAGGRVVKGVEPQTRDIAVSSEPELIPKGFSNELDKALLAFGGLRRLARIFVTATGNDVHWPTWDDTGNSGALLAEATTIGSSVDPTVAEVVFKAWKYSSTPVLVSAELLQDSFFNLAMELGEALGTRIGRITATHYASTNAGTTQPQGIRNGSTAGVTAASATAVTADELIQLQDALDPAYETLPSVGWIMNKTTRGELRTLKGSDNNYLWQPGLQADVPDMLLGRPVSIIQEMPDTATTEIPIIYGAFEKYVIRDAGPPRMFTLEERYRDLDQTGFIMFSRHDGRSLNTGALKRMTMA